MKSPFDMYSLKWLGLRPSQVQMLDIHATSKDFFKTSDVRRLNSLLNSSQEKIPETYRQELLLMKSMGYKVELEALYSKGVTFAAEYFTNALKTKDTI